MGIVSFVFEKMFAEKTGRITDKVDINHNFNITSVERTDVIIEGKKPALKLSFDFNVSYEPNIGNINMSGNLVYFEKEEEITKILNQWKKSKNLPMGITSLVANTVLLKSNIKALMLSQDVNLPPQIQLPKVVPSDSKEKIEDNYIG